jgi:hypothetical protein
MESSKKVNGTALLLIAFTMLASIAGAFSLKQIIPHLNKWQIGGYAIAAGVFIALTTVIIMQIISFFSAE